MKSPPRPLLVLVAAVILAAFSMGPGLALAAGGGDVIPLEELEPEGWTFHTYLGLVLFILFVLIVLVPRVNRRVPAARNAFSALASRFEPARSPKVKSLIMVALGGSAVYAYTYCHFLCEVGGVPIFDCDLSFFHILFRFSLAVFPYFVGGCIVGGLIMRYFAAGRLKMPGSMVGAGVFAALIPVCACGVIPLIRGMLATGRIRVRTIITFLMIAPVLSPFVIAFSFELGASYAIARIASVFVLAIVVGVIVERLVGIKGEGTGPGFYACQGCARSASSPAASNRALIAGWDIMLFLLPYIVIGIVIGALIAKFVPASLVGTYLSSDVTGLLTSASIGLPLFLCSGQEIVILSPLMDVPLMGEHALPLGHAIAFTIAGTGICLSAIPALIPTIGKKAVALVVASFWVGSVLLGLAINSILRLLAS